MSVNSQGMEGNNGSGWERSALSRDGRYVAFESAASNLAPPDTNGQMDIFVRDRSTGSTGRVTVGIGGAEPDNWSTQPSISADGRYVAFASAAGNLVTDDMPDTGDVFVYDRVNRTTERISVGLNGTQPNQYSATPQISANGRYVAFGSLASNLVPGDTNSADDVFVYDRRTRTTERVTFGDALSAAPAISGDGRMVAFVSAAANHVRGDDNQALDVFLYDRGTRITKRVSVSNTGAQSDGSSWAPSLNRDGTVVAFTSAARNLVRGNAPGTTADVFVRDIARRTTEQVSVGVGGIDPEEDSGSIDPSISADGRHVAFHSWEGNMAPGGGNAGASTVYVRDRVAGRNAPVSLVHPDATWGDFTQGASISANGRVVAYSSADTKQVPDDTNGFFDVFVRIIR